MDARLLQTPRKSIQGESVDGELALSLLCDDRLQTRLESDALPSRPGPYSPPRTRDASTKPRTNLTKSGDQSNKNNLITDEFVAIWIKVWARFRPSKKASGIFSLK
jgi:hypothetical protein